MGAHAWGGAGIPPGTRSGFGSFLPLSPPPAPLPGAAASSGNVSREREMSPNALTRGGKATGSAPGEAARPGGGAPTQTQSSKKELRWHRDEAQQLKHPETSQGGWEGHSHAAGGSILALNSQGAAGFHASPSSLGADTGKFAKKHPNTSPNCSEQAGGALPWLRAHRPGSGTGGAGTT